MDRKELAARIYQTANIKGDFLLRSGVRSSEYFDKYLLESDPELLRAIAEHLAPQVPKSADVLAGLEMGGIPVVTMLSQVTGLPACFVRKKAKHYGTCKLAEGAEIKNKRVVIVEDVVTSGGQAILSMADLRSAKARIQDILCVIDREQGGRQKLETAGMKLHALFTKSELEAAAQV
jgi:orotate phosphoribosyltransferase